MKWSLATLVAMVALTGCPGPQGQQGPPGPVGPAGPQGVAGTFMGAFNGDATINGNLAVTGAITSDQSWVLLHNATLTSAADYTISGLDGDSYSRFRIEAEGVIFVGGADKAIGIRVNSDSTNNYTSAMSYDQHTPGNSASSSATGGYGGVGLTQMGFCAANFNTDCQLMCTGELRTKSGNIRTMHSEAVAETVIAACGTVGVGCMTRQRHGAAWRNTSANITSLTFTFNSATGFNGTIRLYGRK